MFPATTQNSRKRRKAKPLLHLLCDPLLLHRACQVHSTIAHTVARQAHTEWRQKNRVYTWRTCSTDHAWVSDNACNMEQDSVRYKFLWPRTKHQRDRSTLVSKLDATSKHVKRLQCKVSTVLCARIRRGSDVLYPQPAACNDQKKTFTYAIVYFSGVLNSSDLKQCLVFARKRLLKTF